MHFTISKAFYALGAAALLALGFDLWNPTGDTEWGTVALGLYGVGFFLEGVGGSHVIFEHKHE